jgi:SNF2 family DNA or RNA helicase
LIYSLNRRHMFLLTATPVQNDLVELFNLLTLLEPGHLRTEADFKRQFIRRGNPRDPRNRERLRGLLSEVMIRNTRGLVQLDLPARYAETLVAEPTADERQLNEAVREFLRAESWEPNAAAGGLEVDEEDGGAEMVAPSATASTRLSRRHAQAILTAWGSHPASIAASLSRLGDQHPRAADIVVAARRIDRSAKDQRFLEILRQAEGHKTLVFVNTRATLQRLQALLGEAGFAYSTFSGAQSRDEKDAAVEQLRTQVPIMLCTDAGGEGRNLQFADTLINYDLPWNPMKIEQRIGRVHRIGQTREVFVFNLCTAGSLEERILRVLNDKIRMFELVVGEVGSILGNLEEGDDFESLVLRMWLQAKSDDELDRQFDGLGESLLAAHEQYVQAKELDDALFGDEYE